MLLSCSDSGVAHSFRAQLEVLRILVAAVLVGYGCVGSNLENTIFEKTTLKGFEPLRAEPNGFPVHHLSHSVTVSLPIPSCRLRCVPGRARPCCMEHVVVRSSRRTLKFARGWRQDGGQRVGAWPAKGCRSSWLRVAHATILHGAWVAGKSEGWRLQLGHFGKLGHFGGRWAESGQAGGRERPCSAG